MIYVLAPASYAQALVWTDLKKTQLPLNSVSFSYRLSSDANLSIMQLRQALELVVIKHESLRTALIFDVNKNVVMQQIIDTDHNNSKELYTFMESFVENDVELKNILHDELINPNYFDLERGLVFRCHIVRSKRNHGNDLLYAGDVLCFTFNPVLIDCPSMKTFLHDLDEAYTMEALTYDHNLILRYIDCETVIFG